MSTNKVCVLRARSFCSPKSRENGAPTLFSYTVVWSLIYNFDCVTAFWPFEESGLESLFVPFSLGFSTKSVWLHTTLDWRIGLRRFHGMPWTPDGSLSVSGSCLTIFRCVYYMYKYRYIYIKNESLNFHLDTRLLVMTFHGYVQI